MLLEGAAAGGVALILYDIAGTFGHPLHQLGEVIYFSVAVADEQHTFTFTLCHQHGDTKD